MRKPRYRWWGFVRKMIRDYPMLEKSVKELRQQNVVGNLSGMPRGGGNGRGLEAVALRQLDNPDDQRVYDAVSNAIELTKLKPCGKEHLELIQMMYWVPRPMTARSASVHLHVAEITAIRWHGEFVRLVAECYGFTV